MKKLCLPLCYVLSLCACTTLGWNGIVGQSFDDVVLKYGVPTSQYTLQNGNTAYSFKKPCAYSQEQEEVLIVVAPDNTVVQTSKVRTCPAAPEDTPPQYIPSKPVVKPQQPAPSVSPATSTSTTVSSQLSEKWEKEKQENLAKLNELKKKLQELQSQESSLNMNLGSLQSNLAMAEALDRQKGTSYTNPSPSITQKKQKIAQVQQELKNVQNEISQLKAQIKILEMRVE